MITSLVTVIHVFVCILLVLIVLLQHGKGADMGASFGGGSQTLFGAAGADNLLTRITTALAAIFMITSVVLASHANEKRAENAGNIFQNVPSEAPVAPAPVAGTTAGAAATGAAAPADASKDAGKDAGKNDSPSAPAAAAPAAETAPVAASPVAETAPAAPASPAAAAAPSAESAKPAAKGKGSTK